MNKKEAIKIIVNCAEKYKNNLVGNNILFVYYDKKAKQYRFFETLFTSSNFMHFTGVVCKEGINANDFFRKCCTRKLAESDFDFRTDGTTVMKLMVLPEIINIHKVSKMTGRFNSSGLSLYTERLAGNVKGCMGFVRENEFFVPNTVLNQDIRQSIYGPQYRIVAVFRKNNNDKVYSELVYIAKNIDIKEIQSGEEITAKVDFESILS